jgi:hypothetical protein
VSGLRVGVQGQRGSRTSRRTHTVRRGGVLADSNGTAWVAKGLLAKKKGGLRSAFAIVLRMQVVTEGIRCNDLQPNRR